jgi:hypothetical protein
MGKRGAEARARKRQAERAASAEVLDGLRSLANTVRRDDLGPMALAVAVDTLGRLARGEIPIRNAGEAADLVRVLVDVARIESGDPTSQSIVAHVGVAEVQALRDQARQALALGDGSPVALAAADDDTP